MSQNSQMTPSELEELKYKVLEVSLGLFQREPNGFLPSVQRIGARSVGDD